MAIKKTETNQYIRITKKEYISLLEDHMLVRALKIAGVEQMPIYKSVQSILEDERVEIHSIPQKYGLPDWFRKKPDKLSDSLPGFLLSELYPTTL